MSMSTRYLCRPIQATLAVALAASPVVAQQRPVPPCDQVETERLCLMQQLQAAEAQLERTYRSAREAADSMLADSVHRAWLRYVEIDCRAAADVYRGGSLASIVGLHCRLEHIRLRTWQLRGDYPADVDSLTPGRRDPRLHRSSKP